MLSNSPLAALVASRRLIRAFIIPAVALLTLSLGMAPASAMGKKKKLTTTVRIHNEANVMDGSAFSAPVKIPYPPYQVYISKIPIISELEIAGYKSYPREDGTYGVLFQLSERGRIALETVSLEHPRTYLIVLVNGRMVEPVFINKPVHDSSFFIKSGISAGDLDLFSKNFKMANPSEELGRVKQAKGELAAGEQQSIKSKKQRAMKVKTKEAPANAPLENSLFLDGPDNDALPVDPVQ